MKIQNRAIRIVVAGVLQIIITGLGYLLIPWTHGTIVWAYMISVPLGVFLGWIRNGQVKIKSKNTVLVFITIVCDVLTIFRYEDAHAGFEEFAFPLLAAIGNFLSIPVKIERLPLVMGHMFWAKCLTLYT